MAATGQVEGQAVRKVYTSGSAADASWNSNAGMASWVLIEGVGTTVLVDESGHNVSIPTAAGMPNKSLPGPWQAFTSTTSGVTVTMGNGGSPPVPATPASAVPATTSATGGVQLDVAPAVAATPIAVGTNSPRVTTIEALVSFSGSDGTLTEQPFPHPAFACTLVAVSVQAPAAAAASDTNYVTITFAKRNGSGGSATTLVAGTTQVTGGVNVGGGLLAFQFVSLGTPSATAILSTDVLTIKSVKTSGGVAIGPAIVRFTFTVP